MAGEKHDKPLFSKEVKSPEERWLVRKLDFVILTYCCISSFFNYLDRAAFANAYVAGLREDLQLGGRDYNVVLSLFTAGSVLGQIPHGVAIQRVPPRVWLPSMVLVWAGLTMCTAACRTYAQLGAVRFLQGLAEASTYCGTIYIIGSWYRPCEIAKRTAIFTAAGQAGSMFAGLMMTAVHKGMAGYGGLAGWKWLFIINGIITCPVAIGGLLYFPDTPELTRAKWLSKAERQLALDRLPPKRADGHNISFKSLVKRTFASPALYILCAFAVICGALEAFVVQNLFLLWLKHYDGHFSQSQINTYPLGVQAVGIVSNFLAAVHIDATGKRVPMGILACVLQLVSAIVLLVPTISFPGRSLRTIWPGPRDDALRSVTLYAMNAVSTCLYTFWGIVLYPASDAPYWKNGYITMIVVVFATLAMVWVVNQLDEWTLASIPRHPAANSRLLRKSRNTLAANRVQVQRRALYL
ncbi:Pantothenate transporter liz1 [Apiospora marii]|uniref:Pantothenate transporter liz1 n=1 Tax=Apiospora marii TaxID=335849 RepID=UPI00312EED54